MAKKKLGAGVLAAAEADAIAGQTYSVSDLGCPGLEIRVAPRGVTWSLRMSHKGKEIRLRIGGLDLLSLEQARALASAAMTLLHDKRLLPDAGWIRHTLIEMGILARQEEAVSIPRRPTRWTFDVARSEYLDECSRTLRPATWRDRRYMLNIAELAPFEHRTVESITIEEFAELVAEIHKSPSRTGGRRERHAEHLVEILRPMWSWLAEKANAMKSGVAPMAMATLRAPKRTLAETLPTGAKPSIGSAPQGTYVPTVRELGRLLALLQADVVKDTVADAALLLLFTSQRRRSVVSALRASFVTEDDGTLVWKVPPAHRKTARRLGSSKTHDLPVPAPVAAMVNGRIEALAKLAQERGEDTIWLFPGLRPQKKGGKVSHIHADTLTHLFDALPGISAAPHDVRRGFTTHCQDMLGLDDDQLKIVLDHAEGRGSDDVTEGSYSKARRLKRKSAILEPWSDMLVAAAAKVRLGDLKVIRQQIVDAYKRQKDADAYERKRRAQKAPAAA